MKRHDNQYLIVRYCFGLIMLSLFSFGIGACKQQPRNLPEKITIAYPPGIFHVLPYIAHTKGFFAEEGLDVALQHYPIGKAALQSLIDGKSDMAISADTPFMFAVLGGKKVSLVAVLASSDKNIVIFAKKDRGIMSPEDLRGRKIGMPFGTSAEYFAELFLSVRGICRDDAAFIDLKADEIVDALVNDRVDAVTAWHPFQAQLQQKLGNNGNIFYDKDIFKDLVCLSASQELIAEHPETLKKVLKALIRTKAFIKTDSDEYKKIASEIMKTDIKMLNEMTDISDFRITLEQSLITGLEDQTRWAIRNKLTDKTEIPDYYDFIYSDALKSVKPEAVSVIR